MFSLLLKELISDFYSIINTPNFCLKVGIFLRFAHEIPTDPFFKSAYGTLGNDLTGTSLGLYRFAKGVTIYRYIRILWYHFADSIYQYA